MMMMTWHVWHDDVALHVRSRICCSLPLHAYRFQHIYMWALFPLMQIAFQVSPATESGSTPRPRACLVADAPRRTASPHQIGDLKGLLQRETSGTKLHGATAGELATVALVRRRLLLLTWQQDTHA